MSQKQVPSRGHPIPRLVAEARRLLSSSDPIVDGEAGHLAPPAVTVCRHLSTIFVTGPLLIGSLRRPSTSHRSSNRLIPQDIFEVAPDRFQVGTQIAVRVNGAAPCGVSMLMDKGLPILKISLLHYEMADGVRARISPH